MYHFLPIVISPLFEVVIQRSSLASFRLYGIVVWCMHKQRPGLSTHKKSDSIMVAYCGSKRLKIIHKGNRAWLGHIIQMTIAKKLLLHVIIISGRLLRMYL